MDIVNAWLQFLISAALVVAGGHLLARYGKELADRKGLSEIWIGFIFLAAVTSLPELATAVGAVTVAEAPALALSDILGSNAFNLFIIALLNLTIAGWTVTARLRLRSFRDLFLITAVMSVILLAGMLVGRHRDLPLLLDISPFSILILILYLGGAWKLFRNEKNQPELPLYESAERIPAGRLYRNLAIAVVMVVAGGFWLAYSGRLIAEVTRWGEGFVGALFLALVTSLPEVAVCLAAARIGAAEMAVGNILGSNIFNLGIVFWADLFWRKGTVLTAADASVYEAGGLSLVLLGVAALALRGRPRRFAGRLSWDTIALIAIYLGGMYWLYRLSSG